MQEADAGVAWTSRSAAERSGVTQTTAAIDLRALLREGHVRAEGSGRARRYVRA